MDEEPQPGPSRGSKRIRKPNQKYLDDYVSDISEKPPRKINKTEENETQNFSEEGETPEIGSILRKGIKFRDSDECLEFMQDGSTNVEEVAVQTDLENDDELDLDFNLSDMEAENSQGSYYHANGS